MIAADRLFEIMDLDSQDDSEKLPVTRNELGDITFEQVKFRYGTRKVVFENISFTIRKGQLTAIVGESGSGKSTIASILTGLYPVESGKVLLGSYPLHSVQQSSLHQLVGVVPQQVDLFAGTVLENIALGEFEPDTQRIMQLADGLGAMDFINDLPGGFGGYLGEHGMNLSGGQRQRLAILRALYHDPEVIIFDEATSALDSRSEALIIKTMLKLRDEGKTVITISHRLRTLTMADHILVIDKGSLTGSGTHIELMETNQTYQALWVNQNETIVTSL